MTDSKHSKFIQLYLSANEDDQLFIEEIFSGLNGYKVSKFKEEISKLEEKMIKLFEERKLFYQEINEQPSFTFVNSNEDELTLQTEQFFTPYITTVPEEDENAEVLEESFDDMEDDYSDEIIEGEIVSPEEFKN